MNIITGNMQPSGGKVLFNGSDIKELGRAYRDRLGYMPQQQGLYNQFTGRRFLWYMATLKGLSHREAKYKINNLLEQMNLTEVADRKIGGYSGGMKQRLLIAQAVMNSPDILVLDEPTAGLDPRGRDEILDQIAMLHEERKISVVLVSHSMEDIAKYVERMIVMNKGEKAFDGTPKEVFSHYKELESMGLAAPQITYIMHALKEKGLPVDPADTTVEEAKQDILHALREMNSSLLKGGVQND